MTVQSIPGLGPLGVWTFQIDAQPMSRSRELAAELDELGFGALWVPEAIGREPFANTALLLQATQRITVATGIASMYSRTPMTMNAGWQTLSEAFPGRFLLGLGVSHKALVEDTFHASYSAKPYSAMVEYLDKMDRSAFAAVVSQSPPQRVLAALGPRMLRLAARAASGAHTYFVPVEHTALARELMGEHALLAPTQTVVFESDPATARSIARRFMAHYLNRPNYVNNLRRLGWGDDDFADGGSDRLVDALVAWGPLEKIAHRVQEQLDAGADHVAVHVTCEEHPGLPVAQWRELATLRDSLRTRHQLVTSSSKAP